MELTDQEVLDRFPRDAIDQDNVDFYRGLLAGELCFRRCTDCGEWHHPPRAFCPACWSAKLESIPSPGTGTVHLLTFLHLGSPAPDVDYEEGHPVATVALDEPSGLRFTATLVGCEREQMKIGMCVELTWIERDGSPVPAFRPAQDAA